MISDPFAVFVILAAVVYLSVLLEERVKVFRSLGAALVGILIGMLLSNLGVIPGNSPTYDFLMGTGVSVAVALILFGVDLHSVRQAGPAMLGAFAIGAVGTAIGAFVSGIFLAPLVGPETWKLSGQFTGTYTGGGMNFAALGRAFDTSSDMFSAATAADVILTAVWMAACLTVPVLMGRTGESAPRAGEGAREGAPMTLERALHHTGRPLEIGEGAGLVALAVGAVWASEWLGTWVSGIPSVLWLTTICLLAAQVGAIKRLAGAAMIGNYLLLLFLASNGARSVVATIFEVGPAVFWFALGTVALHGLFIFGVGRLVRIDFATLAVASQANVGGAASAIALAGARGYSNQLLPGVAVGLLGYAVGNYSGFAVASVVRAIVGG